METYYKRRWWYPFWRKIDKPETRLMLAIFGPFQDKINLEEFPNSIFYLSNGNVIKIERKN